MSVPRWDSVSLEPRLADNNKPILFLEPFGVLSDVIVPFREQLAKWREAPLTELQRKKIDEAQALLEEDERHSRVILGTVGHVGPERLSGRLARN